MNKTNCYLFKIDFESKPEGNILEETYISIGVMFRIIHNIAIGDLKY